MSAMSGPGRASGPGSVRLFVAIDPDDQLRARLADRVEALRAELGRDSEIRWVAPENLHVTLRFIGSVERAQAEAIAGAIEPPMAMSPFEMTPGAGVAFPEARQPRVLAVRVEPSDGFAVVRDEIEGRLVRSGVAPERRPFTPHLTVGRVPPTARGQSGRRLRQTLEQVFAAPLGCCRVDHVTLYESRLTSRMPVYVPLQRIALHGPTRSR